MFRFLLPLLAVGIFSCTAESDSPTQDTVAVTEKVDLRYATNFSVEKRGALTILSIGKAWNGASEQFRYVLYPREQHAPKGFPKAQLIPVPIQKLACTGTAHVAMLDLLGVSHKITGLSDSKYIYNPEILQKVKSKEIVPLGNDNALDYEKIIRLQPEVVFSYSIGRNQHYKKIQDLGIPVVMVSEFMEANPLGQLEWIRFLSYFFDKEVYAKEKCQQIFQNYHQLQQQVDSLQLASPRVLTGSAMEGSWYIAGGKSYMAQFIEDAGGQYIWADEGSKAGVAIDFEAVLAKAQSADIWLNVGRASDLASLGQSDPRYKVFEAYQNGAVYNYTARISPQGGYDFFESAKVRPDLVLKDLVHIFYPQLLPQHQGYYYQQLE